MQLTGSEIAITIAIESGEGVGAFLHLLRGDDPVAILVECRDDGRGRSAIGALPFVPGTVPFSLLPRWPQFLAVELAIVVLVEFAEGRRGIGDFLLGEFVIAVGIKDPQDRWRRWWSGTVIIGAGRQDDEKGNEAGW